MVRNKHVSNKREKKYKVERKNKVYNQINLNTK